MKHTPLLHAVGASAYIITLVFLMNYITGSLPANQMFIPVIALSLFTLSAAVMGYLFLLQPIQLYLDGKKKEAVTFFVHTVGIFAAITLVLLVGIVSGLFA